MSLFPFTQITQIFTVLLPSAPCVYTHKNITHMHIHKLLHVWKMKLGIWCTTETTGCTPHSPCAELYVCNPVCSLSNLPWRPWRAKKTAVLFLMEESESDVLMPLEALNALRSLSSPQKAFCHLGPKNFSGLLPRMAQGGWIAPSMTGTWDICPPWSPQVHHM